MFTSDLMGNGIPQANRLDCGAQTLATLKKSGAAGLASVGSL